MTNPSSSNPWSTYMLEIYGGRRGPQPLGTVEFDKLEKQAIEKLKQWPGAFGYAGGSAGTNSTYRANLRQFGKWGIVPRMLVDATQRNHEVTLFGVKHPSPILLAPIGVQGVFADQGEFYSARAAQKLGIPFIYSTAASRSMEEVAKENGDGHRWYQLYWPKSDDITLSLLKRAKENGYTALVVTLDTMSLGWRPHDLELSYIPFLHGVGIQAGKSDPVFMARYGKKPVHERPAFPYLDRDVDKAIAAGDATAKENVFFGMEWLKEGNSGLYRSWENLKLLRDNWDGPLILKGIQSVVDAEKALEFGVNGIIVSNHGGRQVDGAIPSLLALELICKSQRIKEAQRTGQLTVLFDSGIRTGSDIIKAMALGAQAVLLGRPYLYGMIVAGQEGAEQVIKHTMADLDTNLGLSGYRSLSEIQGRADEVLMKIDEPAGVKL